MLPKANRLARKKDFDRVFQEGKKIKSGQVLFTITSGVAQESRFGFVVSKKVSTKATVRNLVKRRLRAAFLQELPKITGTKIPQDVVVVALPGIQKKEFSEIQRTVSVFLTKLGSQTKDFPAAI